MSGKFFEAVIILFWIVCFFIYLIPVMLEHFSWIYLQFLREYHEIQRHQPPKSSPVYDRDLDDYPGANS